MMAFWLVALCTTASSFVFLEAAAANAVVEPPVPLLNVPFRVTAAFLEVGKNLYVSRSSTCDVKEATGQICILPTNRACDFTVTAGSVGVNARYDNEVPILYLCSSSIPKGPIQTLQLSVIDAVPRFVFPGGPFVVTIGNATPVGTVISFSSDESCTKSIDGQSPVSLDEDRKISLSITSAGVVRLCARVPIQGGASKLNVPAATLLVVQPFSVNNTQTIRNTVDSFSLEPFGQIPFASFARSAVCEPILQEPVRGYVLQNVELPIRVPKGKYYMCAGWPYYKEKQLFVPSKNMVAVSEYGLQPHTMYTNEETIMTPTLDAVTSEGTAGMSAALFRSPECQGNPVIPWSASRKWTVTSSGIYYACVNKGGSTGPTALAANITVVDTPICSLSRSPAIKGLDVTVTLSDRGAANRGIITVGASMTSNCSQIVARGTTTETGNTATFRMPEDALATMSLCVSTPLSNTAPAEGEEGDRGYLYPLGTVPTREYTMSYGPLFAGKKGDIILDSEVRFDAGTEGVFAKGGCTETVGNKFSMNVSTLSDVGFADAGTYGLCVKLPDTPSASAAAPPSSSFARIGHVVVHGPIKMTPASVVVGASTKVSVSLSPPTAPVRVVESDDCNSSSFVAEGTADKKGVANLQVLYTSEKNLTVCVGYRGSDDKRPFILTPVAQLPVARVKVLPQAMIAAQPNRVNLLVPDKVSLTGFQAFLVRGSSVPCSNSVGSAMPVIIPSEGHAFIIFKPSEVSTWTICLGSSGTAFEPAAEITSVSPLSITTDPSSGVVGLPVKLQFDGESLSALKPTRFFVTNSADSCARAEAGPPPMYGEGAIDTTSGKTEAFLTNESGTLVACVGWEVENSRFFVYGGTVVMGKFRALSRYAIRESVNNLTGDPMLSDGSLFLVLCASTSTSSCSSPIESTVCTQAKQRYYTSPLVPLQGAIVGQYVLCQEDAEKKGAAAADNLVSVVDPFVVTLSDNEVRQHKAVNVTLKGGDMNTRPNPITITTMPPGLSCAATSEQSETFEFPVGVSTSEIIVRKMEPFTNGVQLCVRASPNDAIPAVTFDLLPYMDPATIIADRTMTVRSGMWKENVVAKLTAADDCLGNVMSVEPVVIKDYISELHVDGCTDDNMDLTTVHYCESTDGGSVYAFRGVMHFIRLRNCTTDHAGAILPVTVPPAQKVADYGIDTKVLMQPTLSRTPDCKDLVQSENGQMPRHDETLKFFVCVSAKGDPRYVFTTDDPTLHVANFIASPKSIPSRLNSYTGVAIPTTLRLNYPTGTTQTFLSHSAACDNKVANMPDLSQSPPHANLLLTGVSGLKYVCVSVTNSGKSETTTVEVVLVINAPSATKVDPALVRGAPFHATLQVPATSGQPPLYSLVPGADKENSVAPFYVSSFRGVYLSSDACVSVLMGSEVAYSTGSGRIILPTNSIALGVKSFWLCAGTPAGNLTVAAGIEESTAVIFPSKFVLGAEVEVYIPLSPNGMFHMRRDAKCGGNDVVAPFSTDEEGRGNFTFKLTSGAGLPPDGLWTLCKESFSDRAAAATAASMVPRSAMTAEGSGLPLKPLTTVEAFNPVYYNIRGSDIVVGTPGVVMLLDDLTAGSLLPGFSTSRNCLEREETYGSWSALGKGNIASSRRVSISAERPMASVYMCASAPINNSLVSIPMPGALHFVTSAFSLPATVPRCGVTKLNSCVLPGSAPSGASVVVIKGDCCNSADRGNVVGRVTDVDGDQCSLTMDREMLKDIPSTTSLSVCAIDGSDGSYCTTLGHVRPSAQPCGDASGVSGGKLTEGTLIAIIVLVVILGLLLILLVIWLIIYCNQKKKAQLILQKDPVFSLDGDSNPLTVYSASVGDGSQPRSGPFLLGLGRGGRAAGDSQRTITLATTTENTVRRSPSSEGTTDSMRWSLWEGIECDDRDQIALNEARDRYNMRVAFLEGIERLRIAEKERDLEYEFSDADEIPPLEMQETMFTAVRVPSAPGEEASTAPVPAPAEIIIQEPEVTVGNMQQVLFNSPGARSLSSSADQMSYTTTQRFYDDRRFTLENEAVRRQRIVNWEDEEWHSIVDAEFNSYIALEKIAPPPPLPQAVVVPFAAVLDAQAYDDTNNGGAEVEGEEEEDDVYDAPSYPVHLVKYGDRNGDVPAFAGVQQGTDDTRAPQPLPDGDLPSGETILSASMPSLSGAEKGQQPPRQQEQEAEQQLLPHTPQKPFPAHVKGSRRKRLGSPQESPDGHQLEGKEGGTPGSSRRSAHRHVDPLTPPETPPGIDDDDSVPSSRHSKGECAPREAE
ncbi:hypothetical protein DQ04_05591010 [Trypanosoma grayi]|uniref:hypothetical protein n=1 Tax=Trypanosoma grayi TaxID=71804 RepID=UPI0004F40D3D|nr:hypothetical protein DQ04_05591010 [Trypanosoma grayi]KEG09218.1 hypothetical protein DQ04_05591010 [Trypanosoma grayi]